MKIKIYDNGGKSSDQYTVIIDGNVYGMSTNAMAPNGFNQYCCPECELVHTIELGKPVHFEELPDDVKRAIVERMK